MACTVNIWFTRLHNSVDIGNNIGQLQTCHQENMSVKCIPPKPHIYKVKLVFTGVYLLFLILIQNIDCGYSLEPPQRGGSNVYPQSMLSAKLLKISFFPGEFFNICFLKNLNILHRQVCVMLKYARCFLCGK